jgi:DNA modification methylase
MTVTVYHGDGMVVLPTLPAASVQCCVTSPPYFGLRSYPHAPTSWPEVSFVPVAGLPPLTIPAQVCHLGAEPDPWSYIGHLVQVFRAVRRVLRKDGTVWLNLGDSYAGSWGNDAPNGIRGTQRPETERGERWERRAYPDTTRLPATAPAVQDGLKPKDLLMIPSRVVLALQADGWWLRNDIIWHKPNPMPSSVQDRLTVAHEHIFLLAQRERYSYDATAIAEPSVSGHRSGNGFTRPERLVAGGRGNDQSWEPQPTRNARDVWSIPLRPYAGAHFAVFPEDVPRRCILAGTAPQACEHCGAPWRRVVERGEPDADRPQARRARELWAQAGLTEAHLHAIRAVGMADAGKAPHTMHGAGANTPEVQRLAAEAKAALGGYYREFLSGTPRTVGWQPTCGCADQQGTGRCVVLDPFAGSGTTGQVASSLGRASILIEAAADYLPLIARRTGGTAVGQRPPPPPRLREREAPSSAHHHLMPVDEIQRTEF